MLVFLKRSYPTLPCLIGLIIFAQLVLAQGAFAAPRSNDAELSNGTASDEAVDASPNKPWGEFTIKTEDERSPWWITTLLWLPNRVLDLVDVFRVDVGVGPSFGAVARVTKYGQVGYREMAPLSVRFGDFGRSSPIVLERSNEFGAGPGYFPSKDRKVCPGEIGVGADLLIVGGYGGICVEELLDFVAGIFFIDLKKDDLK